MPQMTIEMRAQTEQARNQVVSALGQMQTQAIQLSRELNRLSSEMARQRDVVDKARAAYQNTADRIRQAKEDIRVFKREAAAASDVIKNKESVLRRATVATESWTRKLNEATAAHGANSKEAQRAAVKLTEWAQKAGSAQKSVETLKDRKKQLSQQVSDTRKEIEKLDAQLIREGKSLHTATQEAARLATQKATLAARARDLQTSINETNRQLTQLHRAIREDDKALRDLSGTMTGAVVSGNILTGLLRSIKDGIVGLIQETTMYAARTQELGVVLEQVARVNGISAGQIFAQERAIRRLNVSTQETRQVLSQFVAAQMDVAKASELARVAQDLAVIAGADTAETFQRLTHGIQTLQIRVLRTAGVFVSLDATLDDLARTTGRQRDSFSESEKQAALLNEVLEYGARAVGTYDAAMTSAAKQIRSMTRLWNDAKNALGSFTQGPLLLGVKILSEFLKLVTAAPGAVIIFTGALTAMLAIVTKNALAGTALGVTFGNIARQIALATKQLFVYSAAANAAAGSSTRLAGANAAVGAGSSAFTSGKFVTGLTGAAAGRGAGTSILAGSAARAGVTTLGLGAGAAGGAAALSATGIGLALVAGGAAIYAITQYVRAAKEVNFVKEEDIKLTLRQLDANRKDADSFREQARGLMSQGDAYEAANGQQRRYLMALERLDPAQKSAVENDNSRAQSLLKLADALEEVNRRNVRDLYSSMGRNVSALATNADRTRQAQENLEGIQANRQFYNRRAGTVSGFFTNVSTLVNEGTWANEGLRSREHEAHVEYVTQIEERRRAMEAMSEVALKLRDTQNLSTEAFLGNIRGLEKGSEVYKELYTHVEMYIAQKERERRGDQSLKEFKEALKRQVDELQIAQINASRTGEGMARTMRLLMQQLQNSTNSGRGWGEVVAMNSEAILQFDRDLGAASSSVQDYYRRFSQLDPVLQSAIIDAGRHSGKAVETVSEAMASMQQRLDQVNVRLRNLRREITDIFSGQGLAGQLEVLESRLQRIRQEQQTFIDLSVELGRDPGTPPESAEERDASIRAMQRELELIRTIREVMFSAEGQALEAAKQQIGFEQELIRFRDEQLRQNDIQVRSAEVFSKLGRDRLEQERQITAEIIAQSRIRRGTGPEEAFVRQREVRINALQQYQQRESALTSAVERFTRSQARQMVRGEENILGFQPYMPTFDRPDITRPDLAVRAMPTRTDEIAEYTHATAVNTASIGEVVQEIRDRLPLGGVGIGAAAGTPVPNITFSGSVPNDVLNALQMAVMGQESGGNSRVQNRRTNATGLFQIMPENVGPWTQAALGRGMGVEEFRSNPTAQRQVGRWQLRNYLATQLQATGGDVEEAVRRVASSWYGGPDDATNASRKRFRANEPSFFEYRESVLGRFRKAYGAVTGLGATQESVEDAVDPRRTAELQRRSQEFLRPQRPVMPTVGRPNTPVDEDEVIKVFSNLNEAVATNRTQLEEWRRNIDLLMTTFGDLPSEIRAVSNEVETQEAVFTRLSEVYDSVVAAARELAIVRAVDEREYATRAARNFEIVMRGEINRRNQARETRDEIVRLQDEIAHASEGAADRIESAYLRAVKEIRAQNEQAAIDIRVGLAKIEDAGEFHSVRAQARIVQWASSMKSRSDIYADGVIGTFESVFGVIDDGFSKATARLGIFGGVIKQVMSDLTRMFLSRAFMKLFPQFFGTGGAAQPGQTGGNVGSGANAAVNFGLGIFGGGRGTAGPTGFGTSVFNPNAGSGLFTAPSGVTGTGAGTDFYGRALGNLFNINAGANRENGMPNSQVRWQLQPSPANVAQVVSTSIANPQSARQVGTGGIFGPVGDYLGRLGKIPTTGLEKIAALKGIGGIGAQAAGMLPLLGGGIGGFLTQGGGVGANIAGTAAGTMLGLAGMYGIQAALTTGAVAGGVGANMGALAALATNPFTIAIAGAALVGLAVYSRNKRRRQEEKARTEILLDARGQLQKLLSSVQRDRIDGDSALDQAQQIREQYLSQVSQLKDKKTRNIATATVRELDAVIKQIEVAATQQRRRREIDLNLVPEFNGGGVVPGVDRGRDSVLTMLRPGEVVLNQNQQYNLTRVTSPDIFRQIGVPGFENGGVVRPVTMYQTHSVTNNSGFGGNIYIVMNQRAAEDMARRAGGVILHMVDNAIQNREGLYGTVRETGR